MGFTSKVTMLRQFCMCTLYNLLIECVVKSEHFILLNVGFILVKTAYIVSFLNEQMALYSGFADGSSRHTLNIALVAWVLYSPTSDFVSSGASCLGPAMNNLVEYHAVIGVLTSTLSNDVSWVMVYLDL